MSPLHDIGRILSQVYVQNQSQVEAQPPDVPRLAGGLWAAFKFEEAAAKYKQHLHEHYGFLHILGHNRPVPLEGVFTDVYLYNRPLAQRRLDVAQLEEQFSQLHSEQPGAKRVDGLSLVRTESRLFVIGQPGAGKTTFLKHVALQAAAGDLPGIPIYISLKALADSQKPLLDFMAQEMQICGFPEPTPFLQLMLQSGQMLILLDGLDEVTQAQETSLSLTQGIENLIRQYSATHFLITCRTAVTDHQFPRFTTVEMSNFSSEQVNIFIYKWFRQEPALGNSCLQELNLPEHKGLRDLATTPLLLNLLCLTYEEVGHFPQRRVELYEEALNALLVKWDNSRRIRRDETYHHLGLGRKRQLFNHIAYMTFQQGQYFIPKAAMIRHILDFFKPVPETGELYEDDGEAILRAIEAQHGVIVERARGVYGFAHLTFQEYFTAKYIDAVGEKSWPALFSHCAEPQWREVFLLTTSLLQAADDFLQRFIIELNQQVAHDAKVLALLNWATQKANHEIETLWLLPRVLYTYLALDLARASAFGSAGVLTRIRNRIRARTSASALANVLSSVLDFDFTRALDLTRASARTRSLGRAHTHNRANERARDLARDLDPLTALDFALVYGWLSSLHGLARPFIELAQKISQSQGLASLQAALDGLVIPAADALEHEHQRLAADIWQIARQERQFQLFELTREQVDTLDNYLRGTELLLECLKLSVITDRDAIMARLLVPPQAKSA